jgi:predicted nucleic acid-binding Zn ribbon protein
MICNECGIDREFKDFMGKHTCYRCQYKSKNKPVIEEKQSKKCKVCSKELPSSKWSYCSNKCFDFQYSEMLRIRREKNARRKNMSMTKTHDNNHIMNDMHCIGTFI